MPAALDVKGSAASKESPKKDLKETPVKRLELKGSLADSSKAILLSKDPSDSRRNIRYVAPMRRNQSKSVNDDHQAVREIL